jgi:hypothetical protein
MKDLLERALPFVPADLAAEILEAIQERPRRATRLPEDWRPSPSLMTWASKERPDVCVTVQSDAFRDYWMAKGGKDACKLDWNATFRNWIRNCRSDPRPKAPVRPEFTPKPVEIARSRRSAEPPSQAVRDMMAGLAAKLRINVGVAE